MSELARKDKEGGLGSETMLVIAVLGIVAILIVPLKPVLIDTLLAFNISISLLVLMVAVSLKKVLDFSIFPALLLIITILRLVVNISTTRLILLEGARGAENVSRIVGTIGNVAAGGSIIVGAVVFLLLVIVNFVVITKGSGRVAEVAARFTLDALPGKQMAVDADLSAGNIGEAEARRRREELQEESEFFGAMDGASKFVRGDAVAGIVITAINIVGGFAVGMLMDGLSAGQAAQTYTILTMGDGLITQIPAVLVSTAAGIVVTRASSDGGLSGSMGQQLLGQPKLVYAVSGGMVVMSLVPGMPFLPLFGFAVAGVAASRIISAGPKEDIKPAHFEEPDDKPIRPEELLSLDTLEVSVGYGLLPLIDLSRGGELPGRVTALRKQLAEELGVVLPPVHLKDDLSIQPHEYRVRLMGMDIGKGVAYSERLLVLDPSGNLPNVDGIVETEPAFGLPARWIESSNRTSAEAAGLTVIDTPSVVTTHLAELLRRHAHEILGRQEVQELLAGVSRHSPKLVEDVIPGSVTLGELVQVMRRLLEEKVSVRDLKAVLEGIADAAVRSKEIHYLTEQVRRRLFRQISARVTEGADILHALTLSPTTENILRTSLGQQDGEPVIAPDVNIARRLITEIQNNLAVMAGAGYSPVVLAPPDLRRPLFSFLSRFVPELFVISAQELVPGVTLEPTGNIDVSAGQSLPNQSDVSEFGSERNQARPSQSEVRR